jgi:ribosomal protein S18 acetylase RimI-like enzyme
LIPLALIERPARDFGARGEGLGDILLADAVNRLLSATKTLAIFAMIVDAKDDRAACFYKGFGFSPFPSRPLRLFMPISDAAAALSASTRP